MKKYVAIVSAALGLAAFGLLTSSCTDSAGTHQMGPSGKSHSMADDKMPSRAN